MLLRALLVWGLLLLAAIANGGAREALLTPRLGSHAAHAVSSVTLAAAILVIATLAIGWIGATTSRQAWAIGAGWLLLTVTFEFGFGRARGMPWATLLADYNLLRGRIWLLVLAATSTAPWLAGRVRGLWE